MRLLTTFAIIAGLITTAQPTRAGDFQYVAETAYCIGAIKKSLEPSNELNFADPRPDRLRLKHMQAIVMGAVNSGIISNKIAEALEQVGSQDQALCDEYMSGCPHTRDENAKAARPLETIFATRARIQFANVPRATEIESPLPSNFRTDSATTRTLSAPSSGRTNRHAADAQKRVAANLNAVLIERPIKRSERKPERE